jgi:hypothetical protein
MADGTAELLQAFLGRTLDNRSFSHRDHVRVAFALLREESFSDAAAIFCGALKEIARRAGRPDAFHMTITLGFLSLIAERCAATDYADFAQFERENPDLLVKSAIERWYAPARLHSDVARSTFVLPGQRP